MATSTSAVGRSVRGRKRLLRVIAVLAAIGSFFVAPAWSPGSAIPAAIVWVGVALLLVCIAGRTWCSLYIGGHKVSELVTRGPYSLSRNPLYVFSTIGAVGAGATFGMLTFAIVAGAATLVILGVSLRSEETLLEAVHGEAFRAYCARVPRFGPRFSTWQDADTLTVVPAIVRKVFLDSLFFLLAIPLAAGIAALQAAGWVHPLLALF